MFAFLVKTIIGLAVGVFVKTLSDSTELGLSWPAALIVGLLVTFVGSLLGYELTRKK